ncbi:MAG TPA: lmo0937 family membrane protein [Ruminiclostridium sp.]|mgnify:CR=1 FL=1|jgi:formate hydrogenlyase subunit 4|nr:lmo0937 family membrane protein [Clostridiaceae bacterium]HAA24987.1 lmo0937 family membrane protein [Ruminiclostridium sp.]
MLWIIAAVLFGLWLLGVLTAYTLNGLIHILLVVAIITVVVRLIRGKRVFNR